MLHLSKCQQICIFDHFLICFVTAYSNHVIFSPSFRSGFLPSIFKVYLSLTPHFRFLSLIPRHVSGAEPMKTCEGQRKTRGGAQCNNFHLCRGCNVIKFNYVRACSCVIIILFAHCHICSTHLTVLFSFPFVFRQPHHPLPSVYVLLLIQRFHLISPVPHP